MTWDATKVGKKKDKSEAGDAKMTDVSAESIAANPAMHPSVQAMLDAWEDESDSEDDEAPRKGRKGKRKRDEDAGESATWIKEDGDLPLDFMSADAAHSVLTLRPNKKRARQAESGTFLNKADALRFGKGLKVAPDGRLIVEEEPDEEDKKKAGFTIGSDSGAK